MYSHSCVRLCVLSFAHLFVLSFVRSFVRSFVHSFAGSFVRSVLFIHKVSFFLFYSRLLGCIVRALRFYDFYSESFSLRNV